MKFVKVQGGGYLNVSKVLRFDIDGRQDDYFVSAEMGIDDSVFVGQFPTLAEAEEYLDKLIAKINEEKN